jgi:hypothetical protein
MTDENYIPRPNQALAPAGAPERPTLITIACAIGALGAVGSVPVIFSDFARGVGAWYAPYLASSVIASTVCLVGLWKMRRWGAYLYAGVAVTNQLVVYSMGIWHYLDLLLPAVFAAAAFSQIRKMR